MKPKDFWVRHEFGSDRMAPDDALQLPRFPIIGILDRIRSAHNVGSMFRTADGVRLSRLHLCGYTPTPPHRHLAKTALNAVEAVPWAHHETVEAAIAAARATGALVLGLEKTETSLSLWELPLRFPVALVMGNEKDGLSGETMQACDHIVHLPMSGLKNSLNVSVAFGIAVYEVLRRFEILENISQNNS